jgi:hypothetical protein
VNLDLEVLMLSDAELRRIYKFVYARAEQPAFLQSFAAAYLMATDEQDMRMLRNAAVMFVGKYNLACYLVEPGSVSAERIA